MCAVPVVPGSNMFYGTLSRDLNLEQTRIKKFENRIILHILKWVICKILFLKLYHLERPTNKRNILQIMCIKGHFCHCH